MQTQAHAYTHTNTFLSLLEEPDPEAKMTQLFYKTLIVNTHAHRQSEASKA